MPLALLLASSLAFADAPAPSWEPAYERGTGLATAGAIAGGAGTAAILTGVVVFTGGVFDASLGGDGEMLTSGLGLMLLGGLAIEVGPPLMAGGSLGAARALRAGGSDVGRGLGYATWGLWGGQLALWIATSGSDQAQSGESDVSSLPGLMLLGAYGTGIGQMVVNSRARADLEMSSAGPSDAGLPVRVAWVPGPDGGQLVLSGRF